MEEKQTMEKPGIKIRRVIIKDGKTVPFPKKAAQNDPVLVQKRKIMFVASEARPLQREDLQM